MIKHRDVHKNKIITYQENNERQVVIVGKLKVRNPRAFDNKFFELVRDIDIQPITFI